MSTCEHKDGREESDSSWKYICRINHSCRPCCHVAWSKALEMQTVRNRTHLQRPGGHCVIHRLWIAAEDERRGLLKHQVWLRLCELAFPGGAARADSDARQRRLKAINALLAMSVVPNLFDLLEEKLDILAKEGLPTAWAHMDMVSAFTKCCSLPRLWHCASLDAPSDRGGHIHAGSGLIDRS